MNPGLPLTEGLLQPFSAGAGYQDIIVGTSPVAGANFSFLVTGQNWIRPLGVRCSLTTSASAANRFVSVDYINARGTTYLRNATATVIAANVTGQAFEWNAQRADGAFVANTPVLAPLFPGFIAPGSTLQITVDNIQAADQLSAIVLYIERFDTGSLGYAIGFTPDDMGD